MRNVALRNSKYPFQLYDLSIGRDLVLEFHICFGGEGEVPTFLKHIKVIRDLGNML